MVLQSSALAQYISRSEPVPYNCPSICASGTITLKINQIENLPNGAEIQALLSNATGSFATGTQVLSISEFSTNQGNTWQAGPYNFSGNTSDLYALVIIPGGTPVGNNYTIRIQSSSGYVSNDLFQCGGSNFITVTPLIAPVAGVPQNQQGINSWIGHVYTWTPTTGQELTTPALVNAQNFFSAPNYQGHIVYNNLAFDIVMSEEGGVPGTWNDETSIGCGSSYTENYSMRMLRRENFAPGFYEFTIAGDDGIRFSVDGGTTWILNSFLQQQYAQSFKTTATANPGGICLAGETDLVIEYFQRPADARITFTATQVAGGGNSNPDDLSLCQGENGSMTVGSDIAGNTYQWQVSADGGATFNDVVEGGVLSGTTSATLNFTNIPASFDGYIYHCVISGACGQDIPTESSSLSIQSIPVIVTQPVDQSYCNGQTSGFSVEVEGSNIDFQWQVSSDGGATFTNIPAGSPYSGVSSFALTIVGTPANLVGNIYQVVINGCGAQITSNQASILPGEDIVINQQPVPVTVCQGEAASFSVGATGATTYQWEVNSGSGFNSVNNTNGYSGAQTSTLNLIGAATSVNGLEYRCILSGGCSGDVTSIDVVLTVNPNTAITQAPQDEVICEGEDVVFDINANGSNLSFQWQISTDNGANYTNLTEAPPYSGTNTDELTISNPDISDSGNLFRCEVDGICGNTQVSNAAEFQVTASPQVLVQPIDSEVCEGESIEFNADISGNPQFQWMFSTDGGATFNNLNEGNSYSGVNSATLIINPVSVEMDNYQFMLSASACNAEINSEAASLNVLPLPSVEIIQAPPSVCPGEDAEIVISAENYTGIQWQMDSGSGWTNIFASLTFSGTDSETLTINNIPADLQNANFRAVIESDCATEVLSDEVLLFLNGIPILIASPLSQVACSGGAVNFQTVAQGEGINFQWQQLNEDGDFIDLEDEGFFSGTNTAVMQAEAVNELNNIVVRSLISGCGDEIVSDTARLVVFQNDPVYVPNAFTPDNDLINTKFQIYTTGDPILEASIYNRWGELVYSWTTIDDGWDGTYLGELVQEGVYAYRIKVITQCEQRTRMGTITLIR